MNDRTLCFLMRGDPPTEVLLGFKKAGFGAGKHTGIGGKVEPGEAISSAAVRELEEETGVKVRERDLQYLGHLTFLFPANPAWSQAVHVFQAAVWEGEPAESSEIKPVWFRVNQLPYEQMWQDAPHWLPGILAGEPTRMRFVVEDDNETIRENGITRYTWIHGARPMTDSLILRDVMEDDLPIFFEQRLDPEANFMAAFTAKDPADREAFNAHWKRILADANIIIKTIVCDGRVAGSVLSYEEDGKPEVSYWIGKEYWGQGIATRSLRAFLAQVNRQRPIYARAAKDNRGSIRALEKCGFTVIGEARGFANARGMEIEELVLELTAEEEGEAP